MTGTDVALLARTAVHLKPTQLAHRARLRAQLQALRRWPRAGRRLLAGPDPAAATGWPAGFVPLDGRTSLPWPNPAWLASGKIELLGMARELGNPPDWRQSDAPRLWRFHLHYWDWAWGLAADPDRAAAREVFARLWRSWQETAVFGRGDAWLPYPAALRAWSWCGQYLDLVAGSNLEDRFVAELASHAGFLRRHLEYDVGGNHLVKDLKALAGLAVFFADDQLLRQALRRLVRQLAVQVLPDGGHYERAPAYHCQVLADLIDVAELVRAAGAEPVLELTAAIVRMRSWLGAVLAPAGGVPLLNDGYPIPAGLLAALVPDPPPAGPLHVLPNSGLVRAVAGGWHLLADVGAPCPDELPAHAHADTLGCVAHVDGMPLLVETATSTYEHGPVREYERSTAAHNTVQVDGADSTEVWGAFRAGRRARVRDFAARTNADHIVVDAAHDGFRRLSGRPSHRRRWSLAATGLRVDDLVTGSGRHTAIARWHLAPGTVVRLAVGRAVAATAGGTFEVSVSSSCPLTLTVESGQVAEGFLRTSSAPVLTCRTDAVLPVRVTTWWRMARDQSAIKTAGGM
ncbi:MAG TPA: alginate lyase family protein [Streptosporangiaceae bacterium]|nr:alginate lyase family protein [Streptosporangiaceae bacterium]